MKKYLLPKEGRFYKANLHCHSTYSDGSMTPEELKKAYKAQGYSILSITDHEAVFDHGYLDDEDFLTIPGYEKEINDYSQYDDKIGWDSVLTTHLCIYPKDRNNTATIAFDPEFVHPKFKWMHTPELKEQVTYLGVPYKCEPTVESINYITSEAKKYGYWVTLNHLHWSQQPYEMFSKYEGLSALEIFNTGTNRSGHGGVDSALYDMMIRSGHKIRCVAADDNHNFPKEGPNNECFGGWVMIKAEELSHKSVMDAMEKGYYYSSTGPEIKELYVEDGVLHVECSPVKCIRLVSGNRFCRVARDWEDTLCSAEFKLPKIGGYIRIEIEDSKGGIASTNAIWEDEL